MNQHDFLMIEIQLLMARFGKKRILKAIAETENVDLADIERRIEKLANKGRGKKQRRRKDVSELIEETHLADQGAKTVFENLVYRYDAKEFLPQLKNVRRFLESCGIPAEKLRSRSDALPKVVSVLASQSTGELEKLVADMKALDRGDLGIITDQILGSSDSN